MIPRYWRKIPEYYNLIGKRCLNCKSFYFPKRHICKNCNSDNMQDYKFKGTGEIITYTFIRTPLSDPESENIDIPARNLPYILAIIKLDEGPMLTAEIVDCDEIAIGKKVELVFRKLLTKGKKGIIQYGYKFRLV